MKLATYHDGSRDGQLLVVSKDLRFAHYATGIASRMQQVLDDWSFMAPQLQDLYQQLNAGRAPHAFAFDPSQCRAPLPRAMQWAEAAAYPSHLALTQPEWPLSATEPWLRTGSSDHFWGPCDEVVVPSAAMGIDFGAGLAALTGDLPMGCTAEQALYGIRLLTLSNTLCLRQLMPAASGPAWSYTPCWPGTGMAPVAVTVDELGDAWRGGRLHLPLSSSVNGRKLGMCDAAGGMVFHFGQLLSQLCKTRPIFAGTVVGTGVVSHPSQAAGKGKGKEAQHSWPQGAHSLAEKRAMEQQLNGAASSSYLQFGDSVRIEMKGKDGQSIFGAIDHTIVSPQGEGSTE